MKCATLVKRNKFNILNYHSKDSESASINFIGVTGPMHICNEGKYGNDSIEKIEEDQKQFKSKLNEITTENPKHKQKYQLGTIKNINKFYN